MELFSDAIGKVRSFMEEISPRKVFHGPPALTWPRGGGRNIVLKDDLGLELGNPEKESVSCLLWTGELDRINDGCTHLAGPDFPGSMGMSLPFGKVVMVGVQGFTQDNAYERHKEMDFLRYDLDLKGFMLRAVSQFMREWCRISRSALREGFSSHVLGSALMDELRHLPYVRSVEIFFLTTSREDVLRLGELTAPAERTIGAMNKMAVEMDLNCETCEYRDVCNEAVELKTMRKRLIERKKETGNA